MLSEASILHSKSIDMGSQAEFEEAEDSYADDDQGLLCFVCKNFLNYYPVRLLPNSKSICGRCTVPDAAPAIRNAIIERLFADVLWPCRYQSRGCRLRYRAEDTPKHEACCPFCPVSCAVAEPSCSWQGLLPEYAEHCQKDHADLITDGEFEFDMRQDKEALCLVVKSEQIFEVCWRYDAKDKQFTVCVARNCNCEQMAFKTFTLSLKVGDTELCNVFRTSNSAETKEFQTLSIVPICDNVADCFAVVAKVAIGSSEVADKDVQVVRQPDDSHLRRYLQCTVCEDLVFPPFYRNVDDMGVVCEKCHTSQQRQCPRCKKGLRRKDTLLESMAKSLRIPCNPAKDGCKFVSGEQEEVEEHQLKCIVKDMSLLDLETEPSE